MFNPSTHSLVLRACNEDMSSKNNFKWPTSGVVECPDWDPVPECGNGLHGWLYGHGDGSANDYWAENDKWLVVSVETSTIVRLEGKVKFQKGDVLFCGDRKSATDFLMKHEPSSLKQHIIGAFVTVGDNQTATTGYKGTSNSGNLGISISSDDGTSTSGNYGTSTSGNYGTSTSGNYGISISSNLGKSISGDNGTSISSILGISTSGDYGTSISSDYGTSTSGERGTSTSGERGKSKSGANGIIQIKYFDKNDYKDKIKTGYIGEDGLEPDTFYKLDDNFNFIKCD